MAGRNDKVLELWAYKVILITLFPKIKTYVKMKRRDGQFRKSLSLVPGFRIG